MPWHLITRNEWLLARWGRRKLAAKLSTVMLCVTVLIIPLIFGTIWLSSRQVFLQIEAKNVAAQTARLENSLHLYENNLGNSLGGYACWDDSYKFLANPDPAFVESALNPFTFVNMGVDVITYVKFDGTPVFARAVDLKNEKTLDEETRFFEELTSKGAFFEAAKANEKHAVYVRSARGIYRVQSRWQSDSAGKAKAGGFIVMANLIGTEMLSEALQSDVVLNLNVSSGLAAGLNAKSQPVRTQTKSEAVKTSLGLFDQNQKLVGVVEFESPRNLILAGRQALISLALAIVGGIILLVACGAWAVRQIIVRRLQKLQTFMIGYGEGLELPRDLQTGEDELASLAQSFQALSKELHTAEQELSQKAYLQGKADSASGMLHNVRNALAPVRVVQEKWLREESLPFRQNMIKAAEELARDDLDPERKAALETFMVSAAKQIALGTPGRLHEMEETKGSVDQISAILSGFDFNTSGAHAGDEIDLFKILAHEIKALNGRDGIDVIFDLPEHVPTLLGNPLHLAQVVGNILVNADEAMIAAGVVEKRMQITCDHIGSGMVEIRFSDNGDGIADANIPDCFRREYSTRNHKAGGIGLHWSANAMRAMGGSIALESEGPGKGATAILQLQVAGQESQSSAAA